MTSSTYIPARTEATLVAQSDRMNTLPSHFGQAMLLVERAIYGFMRSLASQYNGGFWKFYELSNGGFYMAPDSAETYRVISPNGFEGDMSADAAGITACLFTFSHLSFHYDDNEAFSRHFHFLREFAVNHAEASSIFAAID
jgi:hypothetical protein